jgi:hypothetical protein
VSIDMAVFVLVGAVLGILACRLIELFKPGRHRR